MMSGSDKAKGSYTSSLCRTSRTSEGGADNAEFEEAGITRFQGLRQKCI